MGPVEDSVIKTKNKNGLHVFTINLDANQDGHGVSPWSVVAIVMATLITYTDRHIIPHRQISGSLPR